MYYEVVEMTLSGLSSLTDRCICWGRIVMGRKTQYSLHTSTNSLTVERYTKVMFIRETDTEIWWGFCIFDKVL